MRWSIDDRVCDVATRLAGWLPRLKWAVSVEDGSEPSRDIGRVCEVLDSVSGIVLYRAGSESRTLRGDCCTRTDRGTNMVVV